MTHWTNLAPASGHKYNSYLHFILDFGFFFFVSFFLIFFSTLILHHLLVEIEKIEVIRKLIEENPDMGRTELSKLLCEMWGWCGANGQLNMK